VFVKPVDDKVLPARVYAPVEVDALVADDLPVLIAEPVRFGVEVRVALRPVSLEEGEGLPAEAAQHEPRVVNDLEIPHDRPGGWTISTCRSAIFGRRGWFYQRRFRRLER